eukprot:TRINITY_DN18251_c0_g1_i1.p1 TRINITY_DN18251_c0_g1~~TRINITY_DN18251_c0_g1_i1.p1  ORF type:complete len:219 (-),score=35.25 TRINITY_DN18251_c0_g1_i1:290-946(-)
MLLRNLILFGCLLALSQSDTQQVDDALNVDSECHDASTCAVSALQIQAATKAAHEQWTGTASSESELEAAASSEKAIEIKWMYDPSYCLSTDGNHKGNGVHLQMWKCAGSSGQLWDMDSDGGSTRIRLHADPSYCVSVDGNHFRNGAKMQLWKCHDEERNQAFDNWAQDRCLGCGRLSPQPTNMNMCMVIDNNRAYNGAKVQMWHCAGEDTYQSWQWY